MTQEVWLAIVTGLLSALILVIGFATRTINNNITTLQASMVSHVKASDHTHGILHSHISEDRQELAALKALSHPKPHKDR